jgi:UDP-2-acetamido-2-deoxy-ribo-hexuluronate aminotransferase
MNARQPLPPLPFNDLAAQYTALRESINARIQRVLDHGQYIMGPEVRELESALAKYTGAKHCITVASGTEALLISLMAIDLRPGDEVITTPFTFAATAETIVLLGGKPVFADIEPDTCNISSAAIKRKLSPRTKAIMPVSLYGQAADMAEIGELAAEHGDIPVIEDAAQSFGARYNDRKSCNLSTIGCTSFFPSKPLGCYGDGGAIFTNNDAIAQACSEIRVHGQSERYVHTRVGVGGRMDTLQCAILLGKLERFDWELERRKILGDYYRSRLAATGLPVRSTAVREGRDCVWAQFTVFVEDRDAVQAKLRAGGIPTSVHYPIPIHMQPAYMHLADPDSCPISVGVSKQVLSLPMSADLSIEKIDRIIAELCKAMSSP